MDLGFSVRKPRVSILGALWALDAYFSSLWCQNLTYFPAPNVWWTYLLSHFSSPLDLLSANSTVHSIYSVPRYLFAPWAFGKCASRPHMHPWSCCIVHGRNATFYSYEARSLPQTEYQTLGTEVPRMGGLVHYLQASRGSVVAVLRCGLSSINSFIFYDFLPNKTPQTNDSSIHHCCHYAPESAKHFRLLVMAVEPLLQESPRAAAWGSEKKIKACNASRDEMGEGRSPFLPGRLPEGSLFLFSSRIQNKAWGD